MSRIEAHPDAAIFPMMSADELADLAADIKENGQRFPIIIGPHEGREVIIDGRNRYAACDIAGVEPKFEQLNGHDPKAFILSVNVKRRHMTAGQRAMAAAMIYPHPEHTYRGKPSKTLSVAEGIRASRLSYARAVFRNAPNSRRRFWTVPCRSMLPTMRCVYCERRKVSRARYGLEPCSSV
jgi:hypothetical protein